MVHTVMMLQLKLISMMHEQCLNRNRTHYVHVYSVEQRKIMNDVLEMLKPVTIDGAIYPPPSQEDMYIAIQMLKDNGISLD